MDVLISGQAGLAITPQGDKMKVWEINSLPHGSELPISQMDCLFYGAQDAYWTKADSEKTLIKKLKIAHHRDRALILTIMLLDSEEKNEIRKDIPNILEELIEDNDVQDFVRNRLFSQPLSSQPSIKETLNFCHNAPQTTSILESVFSNQRGITACRKQWDNLANNLFEDISHKEIFENNIINLGILTEAACAFSSNDNQAFNKAKLDAFMSPEITKLKNYRGVLTSWLNPLTPDRHEKTKQNLFAKMLSAANTANTQSAYMPEKKRLGSLDAHNKAMSQVEEIKRLLTANNVIQARKFVNQLIKSQLDNDDTEHASMSLCNLANDATNKHHKSFALELAERAVQVAPEDGRAWSELADSYYHLYRYEEAREAVQKAKAYNDEVFAKRVEAKTSVAQGDFYGAIEQYKAAVEQHTNEEKNWVNFIGLAELYHKIHEYDEELSVLMQARENFPEEPEVLCAIAQRYARTGHLEKAVEHYKEINKTLGSTYKAHIGIGITFTEMGKYSDALSIYEKTLSEYPDKIEAYLKYTATLRLMNKHKKALQKCEEIKNKFPYDYSGYIEKAKTFADLKQLEKAKKEFLLVFDQFEESIGLRVIHARFLKQIQCYKEALKVYSQILSDSPDSFSAKIGQAELLKEMGHYEDALSFYNRLNDGATKFQIRNSLAALHVTAKNYQAALDLLPESKPLTKKDWIGYHIRGMALLKSGATNDALLHFKNGYKNVPFPSQKEYFSSARSLVHMKAKKYKRALEVLGQSNEPVSNVIKFHAYCGLNKTSDAKRMYKKLKEDNSAKIVPIRDEIAAHFRLSPDNPQHTPQWIHEQECDALAVASSQLKAVA